MAPRVRAVAALLTLMGVAVPAAAQIPDSTIPLRTVQTEVNTVRTEYAEHYNKKDAAALAGMYAEGAIVINVNGSVLVGQAAIRDAFTKQAPTWGHLVITPDSLVAFGSTAIETGISTIHPQGGGEEKARYLVVLRRRMGVWSIVRSAVTPIQPSH